MAAGRTLVAMSGGVDSAVAALLVASAGEQAVGVTLELWSDAENDGDLSCCSAQAVRGARELAHELGMPHLSIDLRAEFRAGVVDGWLSDHAAGLTPNPCVRCNGNVRLDAMLELADRLGSQTLATGHYARVADVAPAAGPPAPLLRIAADERKDQSYVLSALAPESLARLRFPLGDLHKQQVRELAERAGLAVARKRDSQDLCFLAGTRHGDFLERHGGLGARPGPIVDLDGERARRARRRARLHRRPAPRPRHLSAASRCTCSRPTRTPTRVTVGPRRALLAQRAERARGDAASPRARCVDGVRVRAHGRTFACRLAGELEPVRTRSSRVELDEPAERTAPGQIACLYAGDLVVGHGTIAA